VARTTRASWKSRKIVAWVARTRFTEEYTSLIWVMTMLTTSAIVSDVEHDGFDAEEVGM